MRAMVAAAVLLLTTACEAADVGKIMDGYLWEKRVLLIFAPTSDDPRLEAMRTQLRDAEEGLADRDMVIWTIAHQAAVQVDGESKAHLSTPPFYAYFEVAPDTFQVLLLGKDGEEKLRRNAVLPVAELFATIDAMPMRQREMLAQ